MTTLSGIEAAWLFITLAGLIISAANLMDALDSYQIAKRAKLNQAVKLVMAAEHARMELTYLLIHALFFAIGFVAALSPPSPTSLDVASSRIALLAAILIPAAFFTVQIAMIVNSLIVRRDRKYLMAQRLITVEEARHTRQLKPETLAILERLAAQSEALERMLLQEAEEAASALEVPPAGTPETKQE